MGGPNFNATVSGNGNPGVRGISANGNGVVGRSTQSFGVVGQSTESNGVVGRSTASSGVFARSEESDGLRGSTFSGDRLFGGVIGSSTTGGTGVIGFVGGTATAVRGDTQSGLAVHGICTNGQAVRGDGNAGIGVIGTADHVAGLFVGDVYVSGNFFVGGTVNANVKAFRIDHPLDPENRHLVHAAVECPEMKTIYDGIVTIDDTGGATVSLPEWFEALNKDLRYQLTPIGAPAASLYIAKEIERNEFAIGGGTPGLKVSWQVTGVRQDTWAKANPVRVEQDKDKQAEEAIRDIYRSASTKLDRDRPRPEAEG
jgi:hypothetical protein